MTNVTNRRDNWVHRGLDIARIIDSSIEIQEVNKWEETPVGHKEAAQKTPSSIFYR